MIVCAIDEGSRARPIRAPVMPSVHFNESAIPRADSDCLMKAPLNNALIVALNREHTLSSLRREYSRCKFKSTPTPISFRINSRKSTELMGECCRINLVRTKGPLIYWK